MVEALGRDRVDRLGFGNALHQRVHRLVHERHQDPVRDEAGEVARLGRLLAEVAGELDDRGRGLVRRLQRADHLDEPEHGDGVEEVHADDPVGPVRRGCEARDRDRRRVRGEDRRLGEQLVGAAEDVLLHARVLDDGFDQEVGRHEVCDRRHAPEHLVGLRPALLGELREALGHHCERAIGRPWDGVVERHAAAGGGDDLRDPATHLARPDDEDVLEAHGRGD